MAKVCEICGGQVESGLVVHGECLDELREYDYNALKEKLLFDELSEAKRVKERLYKEEGHSYSYCQWLGRHQGLLTAIKILEGEAQR